MNRIFPGIWRKGSHLFTKNLVPGDRTYSKSLVSWKGSELREWNPYRSKPAAAIMKGLKFFPLAAKAKVLYLGIAFGQTSTFFSDIVGKEGIIYGVEISERCLRDINPIAEKRGNIVPILGDARKPEEYDWIEKVDLVYEDVASDDQTPIMIRNCERFLKPNGFAMIAIKARSINVVKRPEEIYKQEIAKLKKHFKILDKVKLDPYEKDHLFVVMKRK
ncbi:MAG: fibrillarin-like rRNA/tRNA 2'-O-methyltransferase [Candidatus Aenigmarchaeota archaeon]|nr:fibrillarin-like rRNA/tRNA 2'-O-methyltransferase [Candidatus Aenigmarchaeota archaeon]NIP40162.1 fibrillarin-like rRNA/tRNA 2'-O-methyltransferase [Candidatus Aenigmarchaeota archaeon]NIQ17206.1 fibrillarin-like rRNA/tRNA 2'-O-methyltransferase [Candidatus Aenigmarchaeota archaeon]NIS72996.1 fibrillarin-like rRNA/tRNA 2'-O-methyltransferase [Candidatus Aenigmarchaeota archaeon]